MSRRFLLVDDEPLALARLSRLIKLIEPTSVCVTASDGIEALERMPQGPWEAVFLDVEMAPIDGFEVLRRIPSDVQIPNVIFCTAFSRYAMRAFEESALDYIVKPIDEDKIRRCLVKSSKVEMTRARILELESALRGPSKEGNLSQHSTISVKVGERLVILSWDDVIYFAADQKVTQVFTAEHEYILDKSLDQLESLLPKDQFFRCHRSILVHLKQIVQFKMGDESHIVLRYNHMVPVSRRKKQELMLRLKF